MLNERLDRKEKESVEREKKIKREKEVQQPRPSRREVVGGQGRKTAEQPPASDEHGFLRPPIIELGEVPRVELVIEDIPKPVKERLIEQPVKPPTVRVDFKPLPAIGSEQIPPKSESDRPAERHIKPPTVTVTFEPTEIAGKIEPQIKTINQEHTPAIKTPSISLPKEMPETPIKFVEREELLASTGHVEAVPGIPSEPVKGKLPEVSEEEILIPDFFKWLRNIPSPLERPVCIILSKGAEDSYVMSTAIVCREIYRMVKGGKPEPRYISEGLKDEIEKYLRAEDRIFIIDDSKCGLLPNFSNFRSAQELLEKGNLEAVLDRLRELFSQNFGFIIFYVSRWAGELTNRFEEKVGAYVEIVSIPSPSWSPGTKKEIAKICWGFTESEGESFDEMFGRSEKGFFEELRKALSDYELGRYIKEDESASQEHEAAKRIVVECLAKELGAVEKDEMIRMLKEKIIETEHEFYGGRADVYLKK